MNRTRTQAPEIYQPHHEASAICISRSKSIVRSFWNSLNPLKREFSIDQWQRIETREGQSREPVRTLVNRDWSI
jgi:hypothetical protein